MTDQDYKYLLNPPPPPPKELPVWLVMLAGVTVGALVAGVVAYKMVLPRLDPGLLSGQLATEESQPAKKSGKRGIEIKAEQVKAEDLPPGAGLPAPTTGTVAVPPQDTRPSFDFYTILPDLETIVSDAELARGNPNPNISSKVIEGMPPPAAQGTAPPVPQAPTGAAEPYASAGFQPQTRVSSVPPPQTASAQIPPPAQAMPPLSQPNSPIIIPPARSRDVAMTPPPASKPAIPAPVSAPTKPTAGSAPGVASIAAPAPSTAPSTAESSVYNLQFGSFRSGTDADRIRGELALLGISTDMEQVQVNNQVYFRVRSGPYNGSSISRVQRRLNEHNIRHLVMKSK